MPVNDRVSGRAFLVDSGADECVFPASPMDQLQTQTTDLIAANGSSIKTFGKRMLSISFSPGHKIRHQFWIANVTKLILGADFFSNNGLVMDLPRRRLVSGSGASFRASITSAPAICGLRLPTFGPYESLLEEFPNLALLGISYR